MNDEIIDSKGKFETILTHISDSVMSMDFEVFKDLSEQCVKVLGNGGKIIVSGIGKNVHVCNKFVDLMIVHGLDARFLDSNIAVHGNIGMVKDGDLVFILSKNGETDESLQLNSMLKKLSITAWSLTFAPESRLAKQSSQNLLLKLDDEDDLWNILPINSTTVCLIVLQELVISIARKMEISVDNLKRNHPKGASENVK